MQTFEEWWNSAPYRQKYSHCHPSYLAGKEAYAAGIAAASATSEASVDTLTRWSYNPQRGTFRHAFGSFVEFNDAIAHTARAVAAAVAPLNRANLELTRVNAEQRLQEQRLELSLKRAAAPQQHAQAALSDDRVFGIAEAHADESREDGKRVLDRGGLLSFATDILAASHQPAAAPAEDVECKQCYGSRVPGEIRGVRCSACNGTTSMPAAAPDAQEKINTALDRADAEDAVRYPAAQQGGELPQDERAEVLSFLNYLAGLNMHATIGGHIPSRAASLSAALAQRAASVPAQTKGRCTLQEHCRCEEYEPDVRAACANWVKDGA